MGFQQICRFRIGNQEAGAGYQVCGRSEGITPEISDEFSNSVKTIKINDADISCPPVFDWSCDQIGNNYYLTSVAPEKDGTTGRRPTPLTHGIVIDGETAKEWLERPERFLTFSDANFITKWDASNLTVQKLDVLEELQYDSGYDFSIRKIREKYSLTQEQFTDLLYHVYEVILSDRRVPQLTFVWDKEKNGYPDVIRDMMFVIYRMVPALLKPWITFSSGRFEGMLSRQFTVSDKPSDGAWFNLKTGESSELEEINEDTAYRYTYIAYLGQHAETEEADELLEWMDEFAQRIYRKPELKSGAVLVNALNAAFASWKQEIPEKYYQLSEVVRIVHSMSLMKVDDRGFLDQKIGELLLYVVQHGAKINDAQMENIRKLYLTTESEGFRRAYQLAVASKDQESVFKALQNTLEEDTDDTFVEILLQKLPVTDQIRTPEVMNALGQRYYTTQSEYLQNYYLDYVREKYHSELTEKQSGEFLLPALEHLTDQESETGQRAIRSLKEQVQCLKEKDQKVSERIFDQFTDIYDTLKDEELKALLQEYVTNCYVSEASDQAVDYFEKLRAADGMLYRDVEQSLYQAQSEVLDRHFAQKRYPSWKKGDLEEQKKAMKAASELPTHKKSYAAIMAQVERLALAAMKEAEQAKEADAEEKKSDLPIRLQKAYKELKDQMKEFDRIGQDPELLEAIEKILNKCRDFYWDAAKKGLYTKAWLKKKDLDCDHPNCVRMKAYFSTLDELKETADARDYRMPEAAMELLTTDQYVENPKKRNQLIDQFLGTLRNRSKKHMDVNLLLVLNYDNESGKLSDTSFLRELTEEQKMDLQVDNYMLELHPELRKVCERKKSHGGGSLLEDKRVLIGGAAAVLVLALVLVGLFVFGPFAKSKTDASSEEIPVVEEETENPEETENIE
jgi:hypothetical protein